MAQITRYSIVCIFLFIATACGVKGDPLPPEKPAEIGRGRPTYKRATEPLKQKDLPPMYDDNDSSDDDEQENQE